MGIDVLCNFGLINVVNMMILFDFGCFICVMVCVFIFVIDSLYIVVVFIIDYGNS